MDIVTDDEMIGITHLFCKVNQIVVDNTFSFQSVILQLKVEIIFSEDIDDIMVEGFV